MDKEVREISRFFVAPPRVFAPSVRAGVQPHPTQNYTLLNIGRLYCEDTFVLISSKGNVQPDGPRCTDVQFSIGLGLAIIGQGRYGQ